MVGSVSRGGNRVDDFMHHHALEGVGRCGPNLADNKLICRGGDAEVNLKATFLIEDVNVSV
jgi:hypothetical protein